MSRKTKDKSPATMPSETPRSEAERETLAARAEPALTARFEALPNKPRNQLLYKPREISAATRESLAKRFESPAGFTTAMSDDERIAALRGEDAPQVLTGCVGISQRLYWILRGIAEMPAAPMPRKRINGVKPSESFIADWRDQVEFWIKSCRAAWRAVELAPIQLDGDDTGISRWSIQAKTAVSRLSHVLGNPAANLAEIPKQAGMELLSQRLASAKAGRDYFFADLLRHLRRYPDLLLPNFYRCVDDLSKLVTMMLVVQSPGEMPQMGREGLHEKAMLILPLLNDTYQKIMTVTAAAKERQICTDRDTVAKYINQLVHARLAIKNSAGNVRRYTPSA